MLVMLDDLTPENGATYFMNGGHFLTERPTEAEFYAKIAPWITSQVFHGSLVF